MVVEMNHPEVDVFGFNTPVIDRSKIGMGEPHTTGKIYQLLLFYQYQ